MKKKILILLTVCMLACIGVFAACGGDGGEKPAPPTPETVYCTVTFNGEGGTTSSVKIESGQTVMQPAAPVREGFVFDGWFAEGAQSAFVFTTPITADITLTAHWSVKEQQPTAFVVTFEGEGIESFTQNVNQGETVLEPEDPVRNGFEFAGWFAEGATDRFDFETVIASNLTLTAHWDISGEIGGKGTKEDPFVICNSDQLVSFAERVNAGEKGFYDAHFRLDADIDMADVNYTPAGKVLPYEEGTPEEDIVQGFSGEFNGNGHVIKNLSFNRVIKRSIQFFGLFGRTYMAYIHDLTIENVNVKAETYTDDFEIGAYIGGVVGGAVLTNFKNVSVTGEFHTCMLPKNAVKMGGIAGGLSVQKVNNQSYISYVENCYTNIQTILDADESGDLGSLDNAAVGGLFGYVSTDNCAAAIINCKTEGKLVGGEFIGGLVGSLGSYISVIDCASSASVEATALEVSYAGGLVGSLNGDSALIDSYSTGRVVGLRAKSQYFQSYAGGLVGYSRVDDYEMSYSPGAVILNCHYSGALSANGANKNDSGIRQVKGTFTKDWILKNLKWHEDCWNFAQASPVPSKVTASEIGQTFTITLSDKNNPQEVLQRGYTPERGYPMIGEIKDRKSVAPELFWAWEFENDIQYRFYIPVVKDIVLTARWHDVSDIAKLYSGSATLHETRDAGIISLGKDGYMQWITDSVVTGKYKYDGKHILFEMDSNTGFVSGTLTGGVFTFTVSAGMSGDVVYTFGEYEGKIIGEYFSDHGDILTFGKEGTLSFQSTDLYDSRYMKAEYTADTSGNILSVKGVSGSGKELNRLFRDMKIEILSDGTLRVNFVSQVEGVASLNNVIFKQMNGVDYTGMKFLGEYNYINPSFSSSMPYQSEYKIILNADGSLIYRSAYSDTNGRYFYFPTENCIKILLEGYASTFMYDSQEQIFHGNMNRGTMANKGTILILSSRGKVKAYMHCKEYGKTENVDFVVFNTDTKSYLMENGKYIADATIQGNFKAGTIVTIQGVQYFATEYIDERSDGYELITVGAEYGEYTHGSKTIQLNGVDGVVCGDKVGRYNVYDDGLVVILYEDDTYFAFDYKQAQKNGNVAVEKKHDGFQGVWFLGSTKENENGEEVLYEKYYKFVVDGFGHTSLMYWNIDGQRYDFNWGASAMYHGWGVYSKTATGISCQFNSIQFADVVFYYNRQLAYSKSFAYMQEAGFYKDGYKGPMVPPILPAEWAGSFEGTTESGTEKLQLRGDCSGIYSGQSFVGIFDGDKTVFFTMNDVLYTINFTDADNLKLHFGEKEYSFAKTGTAVDVIPADLAGIWTGTAIGFGELKVKYDVRIDGTVLYNGNALSNVEYNSETLTITGKCLLGEGSNFETITLEWNSKENKIAVAMVDEENRKYEGILTKTI